MNARNTATSRARRLASMNTVDQLAQRLANLYELETKSQTSPGSRDSFTLLREAIAIRRARSTT
jgi:hypothetical protein